MQALSGGGVGGLLESTTKYISLANNEVYHHNNRDKVAMTPLQLLQN